jgi:hypothetical protein
MGYKSVSTVCIDAQFSVETTCYGLDDQGMGFDCCKGQETLLFPADSRLALDTPRFLFYGYLELLAQG